MLYVVMHPSLEQAGFLNAPGAPTIDEAPGDMTDLGNVVVDRDR